MKLFTATLVVLSWVVTLLPSAMAERILQSNSLNSCQPGSAFSASLFNVVITPNNSMATITLAAVASIQGEVVFDITLNVYGYPFISKTVDPCHDDLKLPGMCPMTPGKVDQIFNIPLGTALDQVPGITYSIPDLDATVRAFVNLTATGESVACVEAEFSTGKTVEQVSVKWVTAIIIGLGLVSSAIISLLGYGNAAAHLAANTLSLFGYFQSQAIVGLTGIDMPPIVQAWTQNFQWSMGIIKVGWMQDVFTWYQRATGGEPARLFNSLATTSVEVTKRSLDFLPGGAASLVNHIPAIAKRDNIELDNGSFLVYGIQRAAFRSKIETTNLFLTGLVFFIIFVTITALAVILFKFIIDLCVKRSWIKSDKFVEFRSEWCTILKGILLRLTLLGFPQMTILCLWEFTQVDSPALVTLAVFFFVGMIIALGWAAFQVVRLAVHSNPTYTLFSDSRILNKWGFLYIQFRASAYYFIFPLLAYTLIKGFFIAFGQHNGVLQAIALIIIEVAALIAISILRPWMDKKTNSFNIAISVFNFLNAIFLLIITNVFKAPNMAASITGIVLFIANAAFSLILLLMIIISSTLVFWRKNPDARYQFMADDRTSFMKSETRLETTNELDALAATARGDTVGYDAQAPRSPLDPSVPLFPARSQNRPCSPMVRSQSPYENSQTTSSAKYQGQNNSDPFADRYEHNTR
ncbi:Fc.00g013180.m01.CDS01 [Cosmosporella sp. VM-42]